MMMLKIVGGGAMEAMDVKLAAAVSLMGGGGGAGGVFFCRGGLRMFLDLARKSH